MYIVIVGGGKVGWGAARDLLASDHEICIIEREPATAAAIKHELGEIALVGDGTEVHVQRAAGVNRADVVVAASGRDQANLAVCQVAQHRFGVERVIARINDPRNEPIFRAVGIHSTISATSAIVASIEEELAVGLFRLSQLRSSPFELLEIVIPPHATVAGRTVKQLGLPPRTILSLLLHPNGEPELPQPDSRIQAGDIVLAVTQPHFENSLRSLLTSAEDQP